MMMILFHRAAAIHAAAALVPFIALEEGGDWPVAA
jgi:hypothetical protein